jgi:hypothetical protein
LVTLPLALSADVAANLVTNTAQQSALPTRSFPAQSVPSDLGATGASPHDTQLSPQILHNAGNQQALTTGAGPRADLPNGPLGIPGVVLDAYLHAQQVMGVQDPGCHLPWYLLAGIGKVESNQAENGEVDSNGTTLAPILGPELNGQNGFAALPAILGGRWTGDPVWQRAVGPMQFLPGTWLTWGNGGNPNNVYDAALAAGRYLCAGGGDLSQPADQAAAVFSYNHSDSYVALVLIWANAYQAGVTPLPETTVLPQGPMPTNRPFPSVPVVPSGPGGSGSSAPSGLAGGQPGGVPGTGGGAATGGGGATGGGSTGGNTPAGTGSPAGSPPPSSSGGGPTPTEDAPPPPDTTSSEPPPPPTTTTTTCPPPPTDTPTPTPTDTPAPGCDTTTTTPPADPAASGDTGAADAASDSTPAT